MPPPLATPATAPGGPADAIAPPDDADVGGPPGAVPSGGAGGMPLPDQGQGMLPPSTGPSPQNVAPSGQEALGRQMMRVYTGSLHFIRSLFTPHSEDEKLISRVFNQLAKRYGTDSDAMRTGGMPSGAAIAQPQGPGGPPLGAGGPGGPGALPPLGGMGGAAGGPPSPPRGPIPMRPGMPAR